MFFTFFFRFFKKAKFSGKFRFLGNFWPELTHEEKQKTKQKSSTRVSHTYSIIAMANNRANCCFLKLSKIRRKHVFLCQRNYLFSQHVSYVRVQEMLFVIIFVSPAAQLSRKKAKRPNNCPHLTKYSYYDESLIFKQSSSPMRSPCC